MDKRVIYGVAGVVLLFAAFLLMVMNIAPSSICGDGSCGAGESCESCAADCGGCGLAEEGCEAGLFWCEEKDLCMESRDYCVETPFGARIGEAANDRWGRSFIYPERGEISYEGWWRSSFNVPEGAEVLHECYIFMRGDSVRNASGVHFLEHGPVTLDGKTICEIEVREGPIEPCGSFTVHIDLESMKGGYDIESDNWEDFFECETDGTDYCRGECDEMMAVLMSQETKEIEITPAS